MSSFTGRRGFAVLASATLLLGTVVAATTVTQAVAAPHQKTSCHMDNGVKHVISLVFDNVHFALALPFAGWTARSRPQGNQAHDPNSTATVPQASRVGTWVEETDLRPTLLHLAGLRDDYPPDGHVISQLLGRPSRALRSIEGLAADYQQLNSSVGRFATNTLIADSNALASGSATNDSTFTREQRVLRALALARDRVASGMKQLLAEAAAGHPPRSREVASARAKARALLAASRFLAFATSH